MSECGVSLCLHPLFTSSSLLFSSSSSSSSFFFFFWLSATTCVSVRLVYLFLFFCRSLILHVIHCRRFAYHSIMCHILDGSSCFNNFTDNLFVPMLDLPRLIWRKRNSSAFEMHIKHIDCICQRVILMRRCYHLPSVVLLISLLYIMECLIRIVQIRFSSGISSLFSLFRCFCVRLCRNNTSSSSLTSIISRRLV